MKYDPENRDHRRLLANTLMVMLMQANFVEETGKLGYGIMERVFSRPIHNGIRILVYTSIAGDEARASGSDAIRVAAVYTGKDGRERGLAKNTRINRTGLVSDIVNRTLERMREVWKTAAHIEKCPKCKAPMFKAKSGQLVCADICWQNRAISSFGA